MKLALQSKSAGTRRTAKWRTICRFLAAEWEKADQAVRLLTELDHMLFRIVVDDDFQAEIFRFVDGQWVEPAVQP